MTVEEKAKRYDEALEIAKKNYVTAQDLCEGSHIGIECFKNTLESIFPSLKESEDNRIRKELTEFLKKASEGFLDSTIQCKTFRKWHVWLEKQGEDKEEINNFDVRPGLYKCVHRMFDGTPDGRLLFEIGNVYKCISKHNRAEFEVSYGHSIYLEDPVVRKYFIPYLPEK